MTLSTSAVAVCCCNDWRSSLSSRVFSMAMTACAAKFDTSSICFSVNGANLLAENADCADQLALLEHRHVDGGARAAELCRIAGGFVANGGGPLFVCTYRRK